MSPDAPTSKWQQPFDAAMTDVFQVQSDIATRVAQALGGALGGGEEKRLSEKPTENLAAYDAFLKGEEASNSLAASDPASLRKALGFYESAVALDPGFAQAWAGVSIANSLLYGNSTPEPGLAAGSLEAARKALAAAPDNASAAVALGTYYRVVERNQPKALEEYQKAAKLAPGNPDPLRSIGRAEMHMGRWQDSILHYDEAERLDPRNAINVGNSAEPLLYLRRCDEAGAAIDRTLALDPANLNRTQSKLRSLLCAGDLGGARKVMAEAARRAGPAEAAAFFIGADTDFVLDADAYALLRRLSLAAFDGDESTWAFSQAWGAWRTGDSAASREFAAKAVPLLEAQIREAPKVVSLHGSLGIALALSGRKDDAIREALLACELDPAEKSPFTGPNQILTLAQTYLIAGEHDKAIEALERLVSVPSWVTPAWLAVDTTWDPLRANPKFQNLLAGAKPRG